MKLLLVHQNFPGQFRDLGPELCNRGHELKAIGTVTNDRSTHRSVALQTRPGDRSGESIHSLEVDEWIHRSEQVAHLAMALKNRAGHLM